MEGRTEKPCERCGWTLYVYPYENPADHKLCSDREKGRAPAEKRKRRGGWRR